MRPRKQEIPWSHEIYRTKQINYFQIKRRYFCPREESTLWPDSVYNKNFPVHTVALTIALHETLKLG